VPLRRLTPSARACCAAARRPEPMSVPCIDQTVSRYRRDRCAPCLWTRNGSVVRTRQ
jgi:hypothetical protein